MKLIVSFLVILLLYGNVFAQKEIIANATDFIKHDQYGKANRYLDSILKKHPRTVDALMMKGNVLLNYTWLHTSKYYFNIERAESVFDTTSISRDFFVPIIPEDTSKLIEHYWRQCLAIDSTRNDIKKGLCNLYSISLRTGPLKQQLEQMKPLITASDDNAFVYAEYARNIKARGAFDTALSVYQFIANMFPQLSGIRCDMAGEYFYTGRPNEALRYLDSTLTKKEIDQTSYINAATIYSMLGYYDQALNTFERYSQQDTLYVAEFYKGLMMFAHNDSGFYEQLQAFLKHADEKSYYDEVTLAQKLLPFGRVGFTLDDYTALIQNEKIPAYYKVLIHQRGMAQFSQVCTPLLLYGYFQCGAKNYSMSRQFLDEALYCKMPDEEKEPYLLAAGFAMYKSNDLETSIKYFEVVIKSKNRYRHQAAKYFAAKALIALNQPIGTTVMQELAHEKEETKYVWLAKNR